MCVCVCVCVYAVLGRVWLLTTPRAAAHQASLSVGFPRQEYWSGLPFPSPVDFSDPGIEPVSPALKVDSLSLSHWGRLIYGYFCSIYLTTLEPVKASGRYHFA